MVRLEIFLSLFVIFLVINSSKGFNDNDLTIHIPPGSAECFYQTINKEKSVEIEYQVIAGGDLDVDFRLTGPNGKVIVAEGKKMMEFIQLIQLNLEIMNYVSVTVSVASLPKQSSLKLFWIQKKMMMRMSGRILLNRMLIMVIG